jgi:hypothetical protein
MNNFSFCSVCTLHVVKIALDYIFQQTYISGWNIFWDDVSERHELRIKIHMVCWNVKNLFAKYLYYKLKSPPLHFCSL